MVEEASPVWWTNGLVTRNHNVIKSNNKLQANSYNHDIQTNKNLIPVKDLQRNHMRQVWQPRSCYICLEHCLKSLPNTRCLKLYKTTERKFILRLCASGGRKRDEKEGWREGSELILQNFKDIGNDTMDTAIFYINDIKLFFFFKEFSLDL